MTALLLSALAWAGPSLDAGDFHVETAGAIGAQWAPFVGDESDVVRFDALAQPSVRVVPASVEAVITGPSHSFAVLNIEEGSVHAGLLEAAGARVGLDYGWLRPWIGRGHLPVTRDRVRDTAQLAFSVRPVVSRMALPLHASGAGVDLAWPERAELRLGTSYASSVSDAPYLWARAAVHPLGSLPELREAPVDGFRAELASAALRMDSPSLGLTTLLSADAELRWGPGLLSASWVRYDKDGLVRDEWLVEGGRTVVPLPDGDLHLLLRVERARALVEGEDARTLGAGRLAWRGEDQRVVVYGEATLSREEGGATSEDVVVLDIERHNDTAAVGMTLRG